MKSILTFLIAVFSITAAFAQTSLYGKVTDASTGDEILFCNILIIQDGVAKHGVNSDIDGNYSIRLDAGVYDVEVSYIGYSTQKIQGVIVLKDKANRLDIVLSEAGIMLEEVVVKNYKVPLIQQDNTTQGGIVTAKDLKKMPTKSATALSGRSAGLSSTANSQQIQVRGNRIKESSKSAPLTIQSPAATRQMPIAMPPPAANSPQQAQTTVAAPPKKELPKSGQLTAGRWNDLENKDYWKEMVEEDLLQWRKHWQMHPMRVVELELLNNAGKPLTDATVQLFDNQPNSNDQPIWTARTDNRGKVALWAAPFAEPTANKNFRAAVVFEGKTYDLDIKRLKEKKNKQLKVNVPCENATNVDILFAIDVSGSMKDELRFLQAELTDVIERASTLNDELNFRTASVCYQSPGDAYITKSSGFTENAALTTSFFGLQEAIGGKGGPEAVERGLEAALDLNWSEQAAARLLFLLLDEPPGHDEKRLKKLQEVSQKAAAKGIKIIPIVGSGAKRDLEFLMRSLALLTNGNYVFLTDDSGIGGSHLEPVTDSYDVELLNDLLVKIITENIELDNCEWLEEEETKAVFSPYPNPAREQVFVDTELTISTLRLYDSAGKLILKEQFEADATLVLNLPALPDGIYFLEGWAADKKVTTRAVMVAQSAESSVGK